MQARSIQQSRPRLERAPSGGRYRAAGDPVPVQPLGLAEAVVPGHPEFGVLVDHGLRGLCRLDDLQAAVSVMPPCDASTCQPPRTGGPGERNRRSAPGTSVGLRIAIRPSLSTGV